MAAKIEERVSDYQFVMRCWEREELSTLFARHGFDNIQYFGAYDHSVELGATNRLVAVAALISLWQFSYLAVGVRRFYLQAGRWGARLFSVAAAMLIPRRRDSRRGRPRGSLAAGVTAR